MSSKSKPFTNFAFSHVKSESQPTLNSLSANAVNDTSNEIENWKNQFNKYKRECDELTERVTRFDEEQRVYIEREKMYREREKRAEVRYQKLLEEYNKSEIENKDKIFELTNENAELRAVKLSLESDVEARKKRFQALEMRVLKLEQDIGMVVNLKKRRKIEEKLGVDKRGLDAMLVEKECSSGDKFMNDKVGIENFVNNQSPVANGHQMIITSQVARSAFNSPVISRNDSPEAARSGKLGVADVIEINDNSDDEVPISSRFTSKPCASSVCGENVVMASSPKFSCNVSSDSGEESDSYMNNMIANLRKKAWAYEADMLMAFDRDPELCLNAVCALYRQHATMVKSVEGSLFSKDRGFYHSDALRGTILARFLTDEDPEGKLKKTVSELQQYDPKVIDECRTMAKRYSNQLFEIYQKEGDPFFRCR